MTSTTPAKETYLTISALDAGHLTLPERLFVTDADPTKRNTVPSLSFLLQHPRPSPTGRPHTNILFDLGLKRDITGYTSTQHAHILQRQPLILFPDCAESLRGNGMDPARDVDMVILSHVHWDHVGTPGDFSSAQFVVGSGTLHLLANGAGRAYPADLFNADELPRDRTEELPPVPGAKGDTAAVKQTKHTWSPLAGFPHAVDFFDDGSLFVIDSPGHLYGHVNLLAHVGRDRWVYLGGDCCHDPRMLSGEKGIAVYEDGFGGVRSVHVDTEEAGKTLGRVREFMKSRRVLGEKEVEVEVVIAHDREWREENGHKFLPGKF